MSVLGQGYARVRIWDTHSQPVEAQVIVRTVRINGQTTAAYYLPAYEAQEPLTLDWQVSVNDDTWLCVTNLEAVPIVVYIDYYRNDSNPWFQPPQGSQDTFTLPAGYRNVFSANDFLKIR